MEKRLSEEQVKKIEEESKKLLNEFSRKLEKLKINLDEKIEGEEGREEGDGWLTDEEFREIIFENAPFVEDDLIIAEKGGWK